MKYEVRLNEFLIQFLTINKFYKSVPQLLLNNYFKMWKNATTVDIENYFQIMFKNKELIKENDIDQLIKNINDFLAAYIDLDSTILINIRNFIKYLKV